MSVHASPPALCGFRYAPCRLFSPDEALAYALCRAMWHPDHSAQDPGCAFSDTPEFYEEWMRLVAAVRGREQALVAALRHIAEFEPAGEFTAKHCMNVMQCFAATTLVQAGFSVTPRPGAAGYEACLAQAFAA